MHAKLEYLVDVQLLNTGIGTGEGGGSRGALAHTFIYFGME